MELEKHWKDARRIISNFNEYGGGPDSEEEDAYDSLEKMAEIVETNDIPWKSRAVILDELLEEFHIGNSGFEDILIDVADSFCQSKERRYLADNLSKGGSSYYRKYAAEIYKSIGDEERFLEIKMKELYCGSDYVSLATFYGESGNREKELEFIWKGLENCKGRLGELIHYVVPIYTEEGNDTELERLYRFVLKTKNDLNIMAIAEELYQYSCTKGDYVSEKKMLLLILDVCGGGEIERWFEICRKKLHEEDWQQEYETILEKVKTKNKKFYLDICMETGKEQIVLKYLQDEGSGYTYWNVDYGQYFSSRLAEKYPDEILALYWRKVDDLLLEANQKNYVDAVNFLKKIKELMKKNDRQAEWDERFSTLKEKHKRKRNFIALLGSV